MSTVTSKWLWYRYWKQFHKEGTNTCWNCGSPAYRMWDNRYNGYRGFCTTCDSNWAES